MARMNLVCILLSSISAAGPAVASVHSNADDARARSEAKLRELMEKHGVPGASIAVFEEGRIRWSAGVGVLEVGTERVVTPESLFQAASISKPVAAAVALRLVEEGTLQLDEDVNPSLESWRVPDHEFDEPVTLRHLLCHGAGLTVHGFPGYEPGVPTPDLIAVLRGAEPANTPPVIVAVSPGKEYRYSGGGYCVAQLLMTEGTGRAFPALARELVLDPAAMKDSTFEQPLPEELEDRAAHGYRRNQEAVPGRWHVYPEMAAAGLWTTPNDLARFAIAVHSGAHGRPGGVLSEGTTTEMLTGGIGQNYGLGWELAGAGDTAAFLHSGVNDGFACFLFCYRKSGSGVVLMTNSDSGREILSEMLAFVRQAHGWDTAK
jgi:CubicO group peptidase (beta-lactamase class C family)